MGKYESLLKALGVVGKAVESVGDDALKALEKVSTAETAVGLKGEARNEYLKALDEVYGPESVRQQLTGHTTDAFHGSPKRNLDQIKTHFEAKRPLERSSTIDTGISVTPDEKFAGRYTGLQGEIYPLKVKKGKTFDYQNPKDIEKLKTQLKKNNAIFDANNKQHLIDVQEGKVVRPEYLDSLSEDGAWNTLELEPVQKALKQLGYNSYHMEESGVKNLGVYDSNQVRSKFAAFDPRFKDSPLLMAGSLAGANVDNINQMDEKMEKKGKTLKDLGIANQDLENAALSGEAVAKLIELYDENLNAPIRKFITEKLSGKRLENAPSGKEQAKMMGITPEEFKIPGTDISISPAGIAGLGLEIVQDPMITIGAASKLGRMLKGAKMAKEEAALAAKGLKYKQGIGDTEQAVKEWAQKKGLPYRQSSSVPLEKSKISFDPAQKQYSPSKEMLNKEKQDWIKQTEEAKNIGDSTNVEELIQLPDAEDGMQLEKLKAELEKFYKNKK